MAKASFFFKVHGAFNPHTKLHTKNYQEFELVSPVIAIWVR